MSITEHDVNRIARLARIELSPEQSARTQHELNGILELIAQPMAHPLSAHQDIHLRLRPDVAWPTHTEAERKALMANSPARHDSLFLVPTVIE
jgi:aspartyl-tRNA(Asn)/glutamyl-tRNA(Gln) amidotransferase subunit C